MKSTTHNNNNHQKNDSMLKEKTNQDFNKQKPNANNPNQIKKHEVGENEETESQKRTIEAENGLILNDSSLDEEGNINHDINKQDPTQSTIGLTNPTRNEGGNAKEVTDEHANNNQNQDTQHRNKGSQAKGNGKSK